MDRRLDCFMQKNTKMILDAICTAFVISHVCLNCVDISLLFQSWAAALKNDLSFMFQFVLGVIVNS